MQPGRMTSPGEALLALIRSQVGQSFFIWVRLPAAKSKYLALVDSGATVSTLTKKLYDAIPVAERPVLGPPDVKIMAGNGTAIDCLGMATFTVRVQDYEFDQLFYVCTNETIGVLGTDFLRKQAVCLDFGSEYMFLRGEWIPVYDSNGQPMKHTRDVTTITAVTLTANARTLLYARMSHAAQSSIEEVRDLVVVPRRDLWFTHRVIAAHTIGRAQKDLITVELCNPNPYDIVLKADVTLGTVEEPEATADYDTPAAPEDSTLEASEALPYDARALVTARVNHLRALTIETPEGVSVPPHLEDMYQQNKAGLNEEEDLKFRWLLHQYSDVFAKDNYDLGNCNIVKHHIDTGDERPVKHHTRRTPQALNQECEKQITQLHKAGRVRPSNSPWGSNILLVKKKDGSWRMCVDYRELNTKTKNNDPYLLPRIDDTIDSLGRAKFFCTLDLIQGYHQVELTEESKAKTAFVVPRMNPSQWEFNFMPFGVQGGPSTFQRLMDRLLQGLEHRVALAYLDDIIVFGATPFVCLAHLQLVFERLRAANLKLKPKKCEFFKKEILYLGHIISGEGIKCDPAKIEAVRKWCKPRTQRQVKVFLGTVNYYNRFLKDFSHHAHPLFQITRKSVKFNWDDDCQVAFEVLKQKLIDAPVMGYPQDEGLFILDTDASGFAIGAVLSQMQYEDDAEESEQVERVIAYGSRTLHKSELRYCTRRRELLAIVHFAKVFRPYLYGRRVVIRTDHASLKYIKSMKDPNEQFSRWIERLEETEYEIVIRQGVKHSNADGLSRMPETTPPCDGKRCICEGVEELERSGDTHDDYTVMSPATADDPSQPVLVMSRRVTCVYQTIETDRRSDDWARLNVFTFDQLWTIDEMVAAQKDDEDIALLYKCKFYDLPPPPWKDVSGGSAALGAYWHDYKRMELHNDMLYRKWESRDGHQIRYQLVLPYKYQELMARHFHDADTAAHMGRRRTFDQVHRRAYWYKMAEDLKFWIKSCDICQRRKRPAHPPHAPQGVYTTGKINERVSLDICGPLVQTERDNEYVLVITDQFSKFTRAFALPNHQALTVANKFLTGWITLFGAPRQVHTDQGREFESALFSQLCTLFKSEKTRTTAYHPSSDGQVERYNQTMMTMINALNKHEHTHWDLQLAHACQAYNGTKHSTTGVEPNRLMFTEMPYVPFDVMTPVSPGEDDLLHHEYIMQVKRRMRRIYQLAREKAGHSATIIKRYNDRKANFHQYSIGDLIMLKSYDFDAGIKKMQDRYEGPYWVLDLLGNLNLRVALDSDTEPRVVHHDRAKPYYARKASDTDTAWVYKRSLTYQYKPPKVDIGTQVEDLTLAEQTNAASGDKSTAEGVARPSDRLQQQITDAQLRHALQAPPAEDHLHQGTSSSTELTNSEVNPTAVQELRSEAATDSEETTDVARDLVHEQSTLSPQAECWAPRKLVKVTCPPEEEVQEIQRRRRGRPRKQPSVVASSPVHARLLEEILCTRSAVGIIPTLCTASTGSQTE